MDGATFICEPEGRGTAAAVAMAAFHLRGRDVIMAVMPSDHHIEGAEIFNAALQRAAEKARENNYCSIGVKPDHPATRYGYIQAGAEGQIEKFIEKPPRPLARTLYKSGDCFWNSGIFLCRPEILLTAMQALTPALYKTAGKAYERAERDKENICPHVYDYAEIPHQAIDYAIMERWSGGQVVPLACGWSDMGCWPSFLRVQKDLIFKNRNLTASHGKKSIQFRSR